MGLMILNVFNQIFTFGIAILVAFGISFVFDLALMKLNRKFVFALPILFFVLGAALWILGLLASDDGDWAAFGLLLYGSFSAIAFVGSLLAGLLLWYKKKS